MDAATQKLYDLSEQACDVASDTTALSDHLVRYREELRRIHAEASDIAVTPEFEERKRDMLIMWRDMIVALDAATAAMGAK